VAVDPHCLCDCGGDYLDCDAGAGAKEERAETWRW